MSTAGKITVELELNDHGFVTRTKQSGKIIREFASDLSHTTTALKKTEKSFGSMMPKIRDFSVIVGLARHALVNLRAVTLDWQHSIIKANAEIERMTMLLRGISSAADDKGAMSEATRDMGFLIDMARSAPFSLNEMGNSFVKMRSVGIDPLDGSFKALIDSVANFGGTDQILHRASVAIQQMAGKGVISMEELRQQLGEAVPNAMKLLSLSIGMSMKDMVDVISKGQLEASSALKRMLSEFEAQMGGSAERMMETWVGLTQRLQVSWDLFKVGIGKTGFFEESKGALQDIISLLDSDAAERFGRLLGNGLKAGIEQARKLVGWLRDNEQRLVTIAGVAKNMLVTLGASALASSAISTLTAIAGGFGKIKTLALSAVGGLTAFRGALAAALGPIGILTAAVIGLWSWFKKTGEEADEAAERILESFGAAAAAKDLELLGDQIKDLETNAVRVKNRIKGVNSGDGSWDIYDKNGKAKRLAELDAELTEIEDKLERYAEAQRQAKEKISENQISRAVEDDMKKLKLVLEKNRRAYVQEQNKVYEALNRKEDPIKQEEALRRRTDGLKAMLNKNIEILKAEVQKTDDELAIPIPDVSGKDAEEWNKRIAITREKRARLMDELNTFRVQAENISETFSPTTLLGGNASGKDTRTLPEKFLANLRAKVEESKAELAGLNGELAKFNSLVKTGADGTASYNGIAVTNDWLSVTRSLIVEEERLNEATKAWKKDNKDAADILSTLDASGHKLTASLEDLNFELANGFAPGSNASRNIEGMRKKLQELANTGNVSADVVAKALKKLDEVAVKQSQEDAKKVVLAYKKQTKEITRSLMTEREGIKARYDEEEQRIRGLLETLELSVSGREELYAALTALHEKFLRDTETPMQKLNREWQDTTSQMERATTDWANKATDAFVDFAKTGKFEFSSLVDSMLEDLLRIAMQKNIIGPLGESLFGGSGGGLLGGLMNGMLGGFGGGADLGVNAHSGAGGVWQLGDAFAMGGIMTDKGKVALRKYATGGIANTPQLAMFGEGSRPEAYVPLPDGKNIPVKMDGGMGNVQVNVINKSGTQMDVTSTNQKMDGRQLILDVVVEAIGRPGKFRDAMQGAMS